MASGPVYYNEIDPHAAAWLRQLIKDGHLPAGDVDERSIEDVVSGDLRHYRQCHFFAGIGGWPLALQLAGWPDDIQVWTGSCPCQPFSAAGAGAGFADERHLWPAWAHLIAQCRPAAVFGEQVASAAAGPWLDLVRSDMEALGHAFGAVAFPAAGIGSPHIRDRTYWGACWFGDGDVARLERLGLGHQAALGRLAPSRPVAAPGEPCGLGDTTARGWAEGRARAESSVSDAAGAHGGLAQHDRDGRAAFPIEGLHHAEHHAEPCSGDRGMADAARGGRVEGGGPYCGDERTRHRSTDDGIVVERSGPLHGFWGSADWLFCRDGKWRPVEPGTFPLAHGLPARMVRLRGYGNAIVPAQAAEFILAFTEAVKAERVMSQ